MPLQLRRATAASPDLASMSAPSPKPLQPAPAARHAARLRSLLPLPLTLTELRQLDAALTSAYRRDQPLPPLLTPQCHVPHTFPPAAPSITTPSASTGGSSSRERADGCLARPSITTPSASPGSSSCEFADALPTPPRIRSNACTPSRMPLRRTHCSNTASSAALTSPSAPPPSHAATPASVTPQLTNELACSGSPQRPAAGAGPAAAPTGLCRRPPHAPPPQPIRSGLSAGPAGEQSTWLRLTRTCSSVAARNVASAAAAAAAASAAAQNVALTPSASTTAPQAAAAAVTAAAGPQASPAAAPDGLLHAMVAAAAATVAAAPHRPLPRPLQRPPPAPRAEAAPCRYPQSRGGGSSSRLSRLLQRLRPTKVHADVDGRARATCAAATAAGIEGFGSVLGATGSPAADAACGAAS
eukprot:365482-Chlamydomonas_euryale.AAC.12